MNLKWISFDEKEPKIGSSIIVLNESGLPVSDAYRVYISKDQIDWYKQIGAIYLIEELPKDIEYAYHIKTQP